VIDRCKHRKESTIRFSERSEFHVVGLLVGLLVSRKVQMYPTF
jgi:hypothetical protein